jgi:hypothetical protein
MSVPNNDPNPDRGASFYDAPRYRRADVDHSEIAAALARFQAKLACGSYLRRHRVGHVWAAFGLLTVAAFAGGLSLARFSFNTPAQAVSVLARDPELMYSPPKDQAIAWANLQARTFAAIAPLAIAPSAGATMSDASVRDDGSSTSATPPRIELDPADPRRGDLNLHELGRSWAEAVRVANAMQWSFNSQSIEPLQHGYSAVEISAIPEASTGLSVAVAIAIILVSSHLVNGRKRSSRTADQNAV